MNKTSKILVGILTIVLVVQTVLLFNLLSRVEVSYTDMTHGHAFMSEKIDVLTGKVNELENKVIEKQESPRLKFDFCFYLNTIYATSIHVCDNS